MRKTVLNCIEQICENNNTSSSNNDNNTTATTPLGSSNIDRNVTRQDSDPQMLLIPFSNREENRRKRREAAMNKSKLAHQYREAKKNGDIKTLQSSKSLLNLLNKTKSKKMNKITNNNKNTKHNKCPNDQKVLVWTSTLWRKY